jgi:hypothetical protein
MSLEKVYNNISNKKIYNLSVGSNFPLIEKDPTIKKLENDVFSQMAENDKKDNPIPETPITNSPDLKFVSFSDAIKELYSITKKDK